MLEDPSLMMESSDTAETQERNRSARLPVVTLAIAAVNVLLWLAVLLATGGARSLQAAFAGGDQALALLVFGAKVNALIERGEYWRLVTPMFLHLNLVHLAVNTYNLLLLGGFIEHLYGRRRFLILYVMSGICGNLASYHLNPVLSVGASTALFGLFGATIVFWFKHRHRMAPEFRQRMGNNLFVLLVLNLMLGHIFPIIDNWGHIGGLLGGILFGAMAESRLADESARAREWLPVPLAMATVLGILAYAGVEMVRSVAAERPMLAAHAARLRGDNSRATAALREAVARHPGVVELRLELTDALIREERWPEVAAILRDVLRQQPGNERLNHNFLMVLLRCRAWSEADDVAERLYRGYVEEAEGVSGQLINRFQKYPPELLLLAGLLTEAKRGKIPERIFRRFLKQRPDDPESLNGLAYLYADTLQRNLDEALRMAQQATAAEPRNGAYWDTLAWVHYRLGHWEDAFAAQREAVILAPDYPEIRFHMGAIQEARGQLAAAREEYQRALRLDPEFEPARAAVRRLSTRPAAAPVTALPP